MFDSFGWGFGHSFLSVIGGMFFFLIGFLCFAVAVGLVFLLVRFLLIGTRAAKIYVDKNQPLHPVAPLETEKAVKVVKPTESALDSRNNATAVVVRAAPSPVVEKAAPSPVVAKAASTAPATATSPTAPSKTATKPVSASPFVAPEKAPTVTPIKTPTKAPAKAPAKPVTDVPRTPKAPATKSSPKAAPKKP